MLYSEKSTEKGPYYLAVPYQGSEEEQKYRTQFSLKAATQALRQGVHLFAPLIYVNKIADELGVISLEKRREIVMPYLFDFLKVSKGLVLVCLNGWRESWGIRGRAQVLSRKQNTCIQIGAKSD